MESVKGKVWRFEDHVDTDQIIPAERLVAENLDKMNEFIFEKVRPGMAQKVGEGDMIVAGKNFGCGSSREHAPRSLIQAGVSCIIAESFARIFFRNSLNVGLLLVECKVEAAEGDDVEVRPKEGVAINHTNGKEFNFPQYPQFVSELVAAGGLMNLIKEGRF